MIEVEAPDGSIVEFPLGTPGKTIEQIMRQNFPPPALDPASDPQRSNIAGKGDKISGDRVDPTPLSVVIGNAGTLGIAEEGGNRFQALTEILGNNLLGGEGPTRFDDALDQARARSDAANAARSRKNPNLTTAAQIGGSVLAGGPAAQLALKTTGLAAQTVRGIGAGAGVGATEGFVTGRGVDDRLDRAGSGAQLGAMFGAAFPSLGKLLGLSVGGIAKRVRTKKLAKDLGISRASAKRIVRAIDDSDAITPISPARSDDLLLEKSPQLSGQAEAIAQQPGRGRQRLITVLSDQNAGAGQRIADVTDSTLGGDVGRVVFKQAVAAEKKAAGVLFNKARASRFKHDLTGTRQILDDLIENSEGGTQRAIQKIRNSTLFDDDLVLQAPSSRVHGLRQELDDLISKAFRKGANNQARLLRQVRADLDERLKSIPGWAQADAKFSSAIKQQDLFADGQKVFTRPAGAPDEIAEELAGLSPAERRAFVAGARNAVSAVMGTARKDSTAAIRLLEQGWNREKLTALLGRKNAQKLIDVLEREGGRVNRNNRILQNSATGFRRQASKEFPNDVDNDATAQSLRQSSLGGMAVEALFRFANMLSAGALNRRNAGIADEMSELLTKSGVDAQKVIDSVRLFIQQNGTAPGKPQIVQFMTGALLNAPAASGVGRPSPTQ